MKIFIPSFNRSRAVFALKVFPSATVMVPASQLADYQRYNPGAAVVAIPDEQDGNLARKRNAIAALGRTEPDGAFVVVDDDVCGLWDKPGQRAVTGDEAGAVLTALAGQALADGAVMFGVHPVKGAPWNGEMEWARNIGLFHLYGFRGAPAIAFDEAVSGFESVDYQFQCREQGLNTVRWERYGLDIVKGGLGGSERAKTKCLAGSEALARKWGNQVVQLTPEGLVCGLNPGAVKRLN